MTLTGKSCKCGRRLRLEIAEEIRDVNRAVALALCPSCEAERGLPPLRGVVVKPNRSGSNIVCSPRKGWTRSSAMAGRTCRC